MNKQYLKGFVKINESQDGFSVIASTSVVDRQGESIDQNGWDLTNYKTNPVILWAHDYSALPIGKAEQIGIVDGQLQMSGIFATAEANPIAEQVRKLYQEGILNTVSVGFIPKERNGNTITKAELLEVSFVPVPANPQALSLAMTKGLDVDNSLVELIEKCVEIDLTEPKEETPPAEETPSETPTEETPKAGTEIQSILLDKETFPTLEEATAWITAHDFHADKYDETENQWRFRQFDPINCSEDTFATINLTTGVNAVICVPQEGKTCGVRIFTEQKELSEKSGRTISTKNRNLILNSISTMKTSIASLEELLTATEPPEKGGDEKTSSVKEVIVQRSESEMSLIEIPVELLKELLTNTRQADKHNELANSVLKRILKGK